jgi:hypothetical protein
MIEMCEIVRKPRAPLKRFPRPTKPSVNTEPLTISSVALRSDRQSVRFEPALPSA